MSKTATIPQVGTRVAVPMERGWAYHDDYNDASTSHQGMAPFSGFGTIAAHVPGSNLVSVDLDCLAPANGPIMCQVDTLTILPVPEPSIAVTLSIANVYVEYGTVTTIVETEVPAPPADEDDRAEWEQDHIYPHTGAGLDGDAGYFVTVTQSSDPDKLPVDTKIEFC